MNNFDQYFNQLNLSLNQANFAKESIKKHYSNGYSKYAQKISVYSTSNIKECKEIWNQFSPKTSVFDTWELRNSFQDSYKQDFKFICLLQDNQLVATLPLSFNTYYNEWGWFGTDWPEDNKFFSKDPLYTPIILFLSPNPITLGGISQEEKDKVHFVDFVEDDPKYTKDISQMKSLDDFLKTLNKKKRANLKRDKRYVDSLSPKIIFNRFEDYHHIDKLTKLRYSAKKLLADFEEQPEVTQTFQNFIDQDKKSYEVRMISLLINNKIAAVDLMCLHNDVYYTLKGGSDVKSYPGIGNYMNLIEIEDAIKLGKKKIDFLQIDYGWKGKWFDEFKTYKYTNKTS